MPQQFVQLAHRCNAFPWTTCYPQKRRSERSKPSFDCFPDGSIPYDQYGCIGYLIHRGWRVLDFGWSGSVNLMRLLSHGPCTEALLMNEERQAFLHGQN